MILLLHIISAFACILITIFVLFSPSKVKLRLLFALTGVTVGTGLLFVFTNQYVNLVQTCISGILFLCFILASGIISQNRLASV